jgi:hypothetical protein
VFHWLVCFPGKETAINYAPGLAADLHRYPAADLLKGHYVVRRSLRIAHAALLLRASCCQSCSAAACALPPLDERLVARAFWDRLRRSAPAVSSRESLPALMPFIT